MMKTTAVVGFVTGEYSKAIEHREQLVFYVKQKQACCGVKTLTCREIKNAKVLADLRAADAGRGKTDVVHVPFGHFSVGSTSPPLMAVNWSLRAACLSCLCHTFASQVIVKSHF